MSYLTDLLTVIYMSIAIAEPDAYKLLAVIGVSLFLLIICEKKGKVSIVYPPIWLLFVFLGALGIETVLAGENPIKIVISRFSIFLPAHLFVYYSSGKRKTLIVNAVFVIWVSVAVRAAYLMCSGQMSARHIASHDAANIPLSGGGYPLAIGSSLLAVYLLEDFLWEKKKSIYKLLICVLLDLVVIKTQSTVTVVSTVIGSVVGIALRACSVSSLRKIRSKQVMGLTILTAAGASFFALKEECGRLLIKYAAGRGRKKYLANRLVELGYLLSGNDIMSAETSDSAKRAVLMMQSLKTFLEHPVFGITRFTGMDFYTQKAYGVGSHGELLDTLARFGIFAGVPYLLVFFSAIAYERRLQEKNIGFGYVISFAMLFIFNPCLYSSLNVVLFFIIPTMTLLRNEKNPIHK